MGRNGSAPHGFWEKMLKKSRFLQENCRCAVYLSFVVGDEVDLKKICGFVLLKYVGCRHIKILQRIGLVLCELC